MAGNAIGVKAIICGGNDPRAVTINVYPARRRTIPGEIHSSFTAHNVALRS
jgi:hypothetical protein